MPRRISQHQPPPPTSREAQTEAWLEQRRPRDIKLVRDRLRDHVGLAASWFPDIPAPVCRGRGNKVDWACEPYAPVGDGLVLFGLLLDRLGPLAEEVVRQGKALLASDALRDALLQAGVPDRKGKYGLHQYTDSAGRGSRLFALLSEAVDRHVQDVPSAVRVLTSDPPDPASLLAPAVAQAASRFVARAAADQHLVNIPGFRPAAVLKQAAVLCGSQCVPPRALRTITEDELQRSLEALFDRWAKKGWNDPIEPDMAVRFAHTLIDPEWYPPDLKDILDTYRAQVRPRLEGQARRLTYLEAQERDDLVQDSAEHGLMRLDRAIIDAYVDPLREPADWQQELTTAWQLRGIREIIEERPPSTDIHEAEGHGVAMTIPWASEWSSPSRSDPVDESYWRNRDLGLTDAPEYRQLVEEQARKGTREPWRLIQEVALLAGKLIDAADEETAGPAGRGRLTADQRDHARQWIRDELGGLLKLGWDQVNSRPDHRPARRNPGELWPGLDVRTAMMDGYPKAWTRQERAAVSVVVERAVLRALVVVTGRTREDAYGDG